MSTTRHVSFGAALIALVLFLTGCTGAADSSQEASPSETASEAFPVTLNHVYGATEIAKKPERVVTMGWITHDVVAALGVVPVGVDESWGGDEEGFTPWFRTEIEDKLSGELPEIIKHDDGGPDYEQILALKPDLILAPHSGFTEVQYKRLAEIAPTVVQAERAWVSGTWQEMTELVGDALGEQEKAAALVGSTQSLIDQAKEDHPNLAGTSFLYTLTGGEGTTELAIYISQDPRVALLREFGLVDSPSLAKTSEGIDADAFYGAASLEELDSVKTDLVVGWSGSPEDTAWTLKNEVISRWEPIAEGRYYFIEDSTLGMATNGPNPLSIAWAIDRGFVDDLSKAIDGGAVVRGVS